MNSCSVSPRLADPGLAFYDPEALMKWVTEVDSVAKVDLDSLPSRFAAAIDLDDTAVLVDSSGLSSRSFIDWTFKRAGRYGWSQDQIVDLHRRAASFFLARPVEPETLSVLTALRDRAEVFFYLTGRSSQSSDFTRENLWQAGLPHLDEVVYTADKSRGVALKALFGEAPLKGTSDLVYMDNSIVNIAGVVQECLEQGIHPHCIWYTRVEPSKPIDDNVGLEFLRKTKLGPIERMTSSDSSAEFFRDC